MKRAWGLGFTLCSLSVMAPAPARADEPADAAPEEGDSRAPDERPPVVHHRHPFLSVDGGYALQSLYGIPMSGMGFTGIAGGVMRDTSAGVAFEFLRGWTAAGLQTTNVDFGGYLEQRMDRLHIGGGLRLGTFDVSRITSTSPLLSLSAGIFVRLAYNLVTWGPGADQALYVLGKLSVDSVGGALFGGGLSLGVRF